MNERGFPLLALLGHGARSELSPLPGVKRKSDFGAVRAALDPERTSIVQAKGRFGSFQGIKLRR